jgi:hypothetical protein
MGDDKKMTEAPHYFALWEENEKQRSIIFDNRRDCQAFIKVIHNREGYKANSLRVITGFELEIERVPDEQAR